MLKPYKMMFSLLSAQERKRFLLLMLVVVVSGVLETFGVAAILPFLQVLSDPDVIQSNGRLAAAYAWLGFTSPQSFALAFGVLVFVMVILSQLFKALTLYATTRFGMMRSYALSTRLLRGYLHQPYVWFLSRHSADLGNGVLSEVDRMVSGVMLPALRLIPGLVTVLLILAVLFVLEPVIAIGAVLILGGAYLMIYVVLRRFLRRVGSERVAAGRERFHAVQEATGGIKELKLMGLEGGYLKRFRTAARRMAETQSISMVLSQSPRFALEALAFGGMILMVLFLMTREGNDIRALIPTLGLVAMAGLKLFPAMQQIYSQVTAIRFNGFVLEKIHADIAGLDGQAARLQAEAEKLPPLHLKAQLELQGVTYGYPNAERPALQDLSLTVRANTTVGFVGSTGAGKTTLVDTLLCLLRPDKGALVVDGQPVSDMMVRSWQKTLGYVPQHIFLTDDTVAANIAFGVGADQIDMAAVQRAAEMACLHEFVMTDMPQGYLTPVGERGVRLSGGQRQRIGIARALYHDPDVLILDEATSALDNTTERMVMEAVHSIGHRKTIVMIAHRLTTVQACDEIFLLRGGQLVASGTYDDLLAKSPDFRRMAEPDQEGPAQEGGSR